MLIRQKKDSRLNLHKAQCRQRPSIQTEKGDVSNKGILLSVCYNSSSIVQYSI